MVRLHRHIASARLACLAFGFLACATPQAVGKHASYAPDFNLKDASGRMRSLTEFRGHVVLLDFWATWCKPCKVSLPVYNTWQDELGERDFVVLAVSLDEEGPQVAEFIQRYAPHVLVLSDPDGIVAARFGLLAMPTAYLIDRDGRLAFGRSERVSSASVASRAHRI